MKQKMYYYRLIIASCLFFTGLSVHASNFGEKLEESLSKYIQKTPSCIVVSYVGKPKLWEMRPDAVKKRILETYYEIAKDEESLWGCFNGDSVWGTLSYDMMQFDECRVVKSLITNMPAERKNFYILDIGAGNFLLGDTIAKFLNTQDDLPNDIQIHIIGIRGEASVEPTENKKVGIGEVRRFGFVSRGGIEYPLHKKKETIGKCTIYKIGHFQIENLLLEFQKHGMNLENSVDFITTRWCFRHLVDPVGTLAQAYTLLRPKTGLFFGDGFFFSTQEQNLKDTYYNRNMAILLAEMKVQFLMGYYTSAHSLYHFVFRKMTYGFPDLKLTYNKMENLESNWMVGSKNIMHFDSQFKEYKQYVKSLKWPKNWTEKCFYGNSKDLFDNLMTIDIWDYDQLYKKLFYQRYSGLSSTKVKPDKTQINK